MTRLARKKILRLFKAGLAVDEIAWNDATLEGWQVEEVIRQALLAQKAVR